jgi:cytochrome P450
MTPTTTEPYYDPFDFEIDTDPYPVWRRLREEAPLYYNERYDFFALSRFQDVKAGMLDWHTFSSARGTLLELLKNDFEVPPGFIIFADPPGHDRHRGLLSRAFTPKKIKALEPKIRELCVECLDPLVGSGGFDFITDLGAHMPMRVIAMLLGFPDTELAALRELIDDGLRLDEGTMPDTAAVQEHNQAQMAAIMDYVDWRAQNPADDIITELLSAELDDGQGGVSHLSREELGNYINLLAAAGNETTTRLIGWSGKVLADHPDQLREVAGNVELVPQTIEEILRFESPAPMLARYVTRDVELHGEVVPAGSAMALLNGSANRDDRQFPHGDSFDIHRRIDQHLAFAYGIHFCLGAALARMEGQIALEEVLKRFPGWEVDTDHAVQARTSTVRGWERLPVKV